VQIQYPDPPFYRKPLPAERVDELLKVDWFSSIKNPQIIAPLALSPEWEDFTLERRNDLTAFVSVKLQHRGSEWNKCARAFRAFFDEHLAPTVLERLAAANLSAELIGCVGWDIVSYMQELNYSDIRRPGFFQHLWLTYRSGNFPCGWNGSYPQGSLITA
jgi:hypothetical protein